MCNYYLIKVSIRCTEKIIATLQITKHLTDYLSIIRVNLKILPHCGKTVELLLANQTSIIMKPKNIFIVSNRLPITIVRFEDGFKITRSSGGLATALQSVFQQQNSRWIGWPGIIAQTKEEEEQIIKLLKPLRCIPVFLTQAELDGYYNGFSNAILWPLFHYHPGHCVFEQEYWETYKQVNIKFSSSINRHTKESDFVWIHDYQLMLTPSYVNRPYMSYFHHIHFPSVEVFGIIPWRTELLEAVYKCKHLVFQTEQDCNNFKLAYNRFAANHLKNNTSDTSHKISFHPISIDAQEFSLTAETENVKQLARKITLAFEPQKIILSVDRLDYSKGVLERLIAFKELLEDYPHYRNKIALVMIVVPSRTNVPSYEKHKRKVDELVGNINAMFATPEWHPINYYYQNFDREALCAYYAAADVCLITSLRDGLNLVSKEYVACRNSSTGILILSEMAGAAQELKFALKVHPYDSAQIKEAVNYALSINKQEESARMESLRTQVFNNTIFDWVKRIFEEIFCLYPELSTSCEQKLNAQLINILTSEFKQAQKRYILLDYDGCLRDLEPHPELATPTSEIHKLLDKLTLLPDTEVFLVSGRSMTDMENWFGKSGVNIIAEHGAWYKKHLTEWVDLRPDVSINKELFLSLLIQYAQRIPNSFIEEKSTGYCLHFRESKPKDVSLYLDQLVSDFCNFIKSNNLPYRCTVSPTQFEVHPLGCNKGKALQRIISFEENSFILAAGDDDTDEDMFEVLPTAAFTIKIGRKETCAKIRVPEVNRFVGFLSELAELPLAEK